MTWKGNHPKCGNTVTIALVHVLAPNKDRHCSGCICLVLCMLLCLNSCISTEYKLEYMCIRQRHQVQLLRNTPAFYIATLVKVLFCFIHQRVLLGRVVSKDSIWIWISLLYAIRWYQNVYFVGQKLYATLMQESSK